MIVGGTGNGKFNNKGSETTTALLTVRTYWAPVRAKILPPKVNVMTGRVGILVQSTMYCSTKTVEQLKKKKRKKEL